ncbi:outer membrane protein/protective antigen OMA87 [Pedobacter glucosidilyticus]|nr:BamA/TamA family outer membrane protein [Pedobacter glucosidilyticus]KHJ38486.1 outer membrane protein/protective antigen OMA87 [Pedobacter glucosidilyticus]
MMKRYLIVFMLSFLMSACSNIKYLPKGEQLYVGAEVNITDKETTKSERKSLTSELEGVLRPRPNSKILGLRPKLFFYNIAGTPKKQKGLRNWLKNKVGEPPVLMSQVDLDYNASIIQNRLENKGYFLAETTADSTERNRKVKAQYSVQTKKQYKIRKVVFPQDSSVITKAIKETEANTFLKATEAYDLDKIKAERERIDVRLKEKGFYYFGPDYLIVKVDSTVGNQQVDLFLEVKKETPANAKQVYTINDIFIYPDYSLRKERRLNIDSAVVYKDFKIIDDGEPLFKPQVFDRTLFFHKGDVYNRTDHNLSLNRLVNLGVFRFVKNQFKETDSIQNVLDAYYYLTPREKKSIRFELLGKTNSANYTGTEVNINWSNRNTFKGAEQLTITGFGGVETQVSGQNKGFNVYRFGADASLIWPRFITPFNIKGTSAFVPKTRATLGYEFQNRVKLYSLNTFKGSFGYLWKEEIRKEHQLNLIDVTYVNSFNVSDLYRRQIDSIPSLARVIEKQLIFGPTYSFTFTNTTETNKIHTFYYKGSIDLSATITGLIKNGNVKRGNTATILNVPYSEFAKTEHDFRYYLRLNDRNRIASRIIIGAGLPYGNSSSLPFIKQFFSGGTNSIRAFRARSLGPGTFRYDVDEDSFLPDQSGDFKLELNAEYRAKLFSIVEGAAFIDAGNIWMANEDPNRPGAVLSKDFMKELAVGTGVGLRFDLSFLILRGDLAFPIRKPYLPDGERWVLNQIDFGNREWRRENLVFNLAIGYPF